MSDTILKQYLQPFPGECRFIFAPPATGRTRTWIFGTDDMPDLILNFHLASFLTHGWRVVESSPSIVAERDGSGISVSAMRRRDETRIVYEVRTTQGDI